MKKQLTLILPCVLIITILSSCSANKRLLNVYSNVVNQQPNLCTSEVNFEEPVNDYSEGQCLSQNTKTDVCIASQKKPLVDSSLVIQSFRHFVYRSSYRPTIKKTKPFNAYINCLSSTDEILYQSSFGPFLLITSSCFTLIGLTIFVYKRNKTGV